MQLTTVIHFQLNRMRGHAKARDLLHLQANVSVDHVIREHAATSQKLAILVQMLHGHIERMTYRGDVLRLFGLEIVEILVSRIARVELVLNSIQPRHHHCGKRKVRVGAGIRETHFDAPCLGI